tara:strand:+ start:1427 stop:1639 length:213 start_codon:yes stop_codon:yes gene_type:complete
MDNQDYRTTYARHDEKLKNIYSTLNRIENHLAKLNGSVGRHEINIAKMQVWGGVALITFPIIVNTIMRLI